MKKLNRKVEIMNIAPVQIIFYVFSAVALLSAVAVITARNPVRSVLSLVITFFAMAGVWMILHAEFLSLILVLVYVGAVMTLFLFVVMMLNIDRAKKKEGFVKHLPLVLIIAIVLTALVIVGLDGEQMPLPPAVPADFSNTAHLGELLFTQYVYPFEVAGVVLLAAMIAAIALTHRKPRRKVQSASAQIAVQPEDRVRLINVPSEPRQPSNKDAGKKEE